MIPDFTPPPEGAARAITACCETLQFRVEADSERGSAEAVLVSTYLKGVRVAQLEIPDGHGVLQGYHALLMHAYLLLTVTEEFPGVCGQLWAVLPSGDEEFDDGALQASAGAYPRQPFEDIPPWAPTSADEDRADQLDGGPALALFIGEVQRLEGLRVSPNDAGAEAEDMLLHILRGDEPRLADQVIAFLTV